MARILWLCTFTNDEKRSHLSLWRSRRFEVGQWIPNLLRHFEAAPRGDEIHVVSTDLWMKAAIQSWESRGIHYHCFKSGIPFLGRPWPARFPVDHLTDFWVNRRRIAKIVEAVKPDLIHLFGVENPQYGAAALDVLGTYPVFVTIQGFIHRERQYHDTLITRTRCRFEEVLLRACPAFSGDYDSEKVVRHFNAGASFDHVYFPVDEKLISLTPASVERDYDLLFVGGLTPQKGFFDFLEIVRLLSASRPTLRAAVVGQIDACPPARAFINENRLARHVEWIPRFPSQEGLFKTFRQAKLLLVPTYNDAFPSIIRESMLLGTPVVAYSTGGIPWANRDGHENVMLVEQGDVKRMAETAAALLADIPSRERLARRAQQFAESEFSLSVNAERIRMCYRQILGVQ